MTKSRQFQVKGKLWKCLAFLLTQTCMYTRARKRLSYMKTNIYQVPDMLASLVAHTVKNLSAMWETQVRSPAGEDPLKKGMATHSSILAWRIPWTEKPGGLQSMGLQKVGHNWMNIKKYAFRRGLALHRLLYLSIISYHSPWYWYQQSLILKKTILDNP